MHLIALEMSWGPIMYEAVYKITGFTFALLLLTERSCDKVTSLREEKTTIQQQMKKLQDDLEEQQRDNDELKFDYERATKEVRYLLYLLTLLYL